MRLTCLVDNAVKPMSRLWGEHGLSYLVEADGQRLLLDTGQSGSVLLHNLELLGVELATIDAVAISHAHYDHTGGLPALLGRLRPNIPLFAIADLFRERFIQRDGPPKRIGLPLSREKLATCFDLRLSDAPREIVPGVWTTGEIGERTEFEGRSKGLLMAVEGELVADAFRDDMALVLRSGDHLALLCGCCHAGLLNTLAHVERIFSHPVGLIAGGLHLAGVEDLAVRRCGERLAAMTNLVHVYAGHCTGEAAYLSLHQALRPAIVQPGHAGTVISIDSTNATPALDL